MFIFEILNHHVCSCYKMDKAQNLLISEHKHKYLYVQHHEIGAELSEGCLVREQFQALSAMMSASIQWVPPSTCLIANTTPRNLLQKPSTNKLSSFTLVIFSSVV